jgi:hypothetical protein
MKNYLHFIYRRSKKNSINSRKEYEKIFNDHIVAQHSSVIVIPLE